MSTNQPSPFGPPRMSNAINREQLAAIGINLQAVERKGEILKTLEARVGIEPTNKGFADLNLSPLSHFRINAGGSPIRNSVRNLSPSRPTPEASE